MAKKTEKKTEEEKPIEKKYPSVVLGLDISTACIGISIVYDDGENEPEIIKITHVALKVDNNVKGIEALIQRKRIFEEQFLTKVKEEIKITECVIEAPLTFATGKSTAHTVSQLLQFNALISEAIYDELGIIPYYFTSYDARMYAFPELLSVRKFNKKGEIYPYKHISKALEENTLILFGSYPFDCEKKTIMMECVNEKYRDIQWALNKKGELDKKNYDACDSLICSLAYINKKKYGTINPTVKNVSSTASSGSPSVFEYCVKVWDNYPEIYKKLILE